MATKPTTSKATKATTTPAAAPAAPIVANPFAGVVQALAAPAPAPVGTTAPKVHSVTLANGDTIRTANHVATLKGGTACPVQFAVTSYRLTTTPYQPKATTLTSLQWAAFKGAIEANGGTATGQQVWEAGQALGMQGAALASLVGFAPYRSRNIAKV